MARLRIGTCSWKFPSWSGLVYSAPKGINYLAEYARHVAGSAEEYLKSLDESALDRVPDPGKPKRTIEVILRSFVIAHGWWHIGEIKYLKGLQGMPFAY